MQNMVKTFDKGLQLIQMDGTNKLSYKGYSLNIDVHYAGDVLDKKWKRS